MCSTPPASTFADRMAPFQPASAEGRPEDLAAADAAGPSRPPLTRQTRPLRVPLSSAQQRLWFVDKLQAGCAPEYHVISGMQVRGALNRPALSRALQTVITRHESLRTHFEEDEHGVAQVIDDTACVDVPLEDLRGQPDESQWRAIEEHRQHEATTPFDLSRGPVVRACVMQLAEDHHVLLRTVHHIATDAWSEALFRRELLTLYDAFSTGRDHRLTALPVQYADFALWERSWLSGDPRGAGLAYWQQQLADMPGPLTLPTDCPRPRVPTSDAETCEREVPPQTATALKRLARSHHATLYMAMVAAFGVLLARYTGESDIVVGSLAANRQDVQLESLIGFFANIIAIRLRIREEQTFVELLQQARRTTLDACRYQDVPFDRVVEATAPRRSVSSTSMLQVLFHLQNRASARPRTAATVQFDALELAEPHVRYDLEVSVSERGTRVFVSWLYRRDLFASWRIAQMAQHYERVLAAVSSNPEDALWRVDVLNAAEQRQLLYGGSR